MKTEIIVYAPKLLENMELLGVKGREEKGYLIIEGDLAALRDAAGVDVSGTVLNSLVAITRALTENKYIYSASVRCSNEAVYYSADYDASDIRHMYYELKRTMDEGVLIV